MVATEFRTILEKIDQDLQNLLQDHSVRVSFPDPDDRAYDLGEAEILRRIGVVADYLAHASEGCQACQEGIDNDIHHARQQISNYLSNRLTDPMLFYQATYQKHDRTAAQTILYQSSNGKITIKSLHTDFARQVQTIVDSQKNSIHLPGAVDDYRLIHTNKGDRDGPLEIVLFKQELP